MKNPAFHRFGALRTEDPSEILRGHQGLQKALGVDIEKSLF